MTKTVYLAPDLGQWEIKKSKMNKKRERAGYAQWTVLYVRRVLYDIPSSRFQARSPWSKKLWSRDSHGKGFLRWLKTGFLIALFAFFVWTAQEAHQGPHEIIG
jgi:hypothetical protein